jgi:DNA-binding transcriptional LysR family regulator
LGEAKRLLALAESAPDLARRISRGSVGTVRIGFTAGSAYGVLPGLLDHLSRTVPDIDVDLYEMVTRQQIEALLTHRIDLGLARPPFDPAEFDSRLVKREDMMVVVPAGHPLASLRRAVHPSDLTSEPLIMYTPIQARYFYDLVVGIVPVVHDNVVHSVSQILTVVWLVSARRGIGFVPRSAALLGIDGIKYLSLATHPPRPAELHLLWPRESDNRALSGALRALDGFLADL